MFWDSIVKSNLAVACRVLLQAGKQHRGPAHPVGDLPVRLADDNDVTIYMINECEWSIALQVCSQGLDSPTYCSLTLI